MYGVVARQGLNFEPYGIVRVEDREGNVLYTHKPAPSHLLLGASLAAQMTQMLQAVMMYGTGRKAAIPGFCAGKTGTTQDDRDSWFVGFTPSMITGVWAGNDDNKSMDLITQGSPSVYAWRLFMEGAPVEDVSEEPMDIEGILEGIE
jgi:penicillin-binding protein 1A